MEVNLKLPKHEMILEDILAKTMAPDDRSKQVSKNVVVMLSKIPLGRDYEFMLDNDYANNLMRAHFLHVFQELAEIRNSLKDLTPVFRSSQKRVQLRVLFYARNHTSISNRAQSLIPGRQGNTNNELNESDDSKSFLTRLRHIILCIIVPFYHPTSKWPSKKNAAKRILDEFKTFYVINGISFRSYVNRALMRCERLEKILHNMREQIKHPTWNVNGVGDGLAFQLRVPREDMSRWRRDVDLAWREVRSVKRMFGLMPTHHGWQAIFNIMTRQSSFNHCF